MRGPLILPSASSAALLLLLSPAAMAAPRTHVVLIDKMKFGPVPAAVRPGDVILWDNRDMFRHTATARGGGFDVDLAPSAKARTVIRGSGAIKVYCRFHPGMTAALRVKA